MTSNPRMRLALGIVFICMKPSHAADSIQSRVGESCLLTSSYSEISTEKVQEAVTHGMPVDIKHAVITGDELNLSKQAVLQPFHISDSIIRARLNFMDTVFSDDFNVADTCIERAR